MHDIGSAYSLLGENQKALEYFNQGLVIQVEPKHGIVKGNILLGIASVYSGFGDKQKAIDYYNQALSVFQSEKQDSLTAGTFSSIAQDYKDLGQAQDAIDSYNKALKIHRKNKELEGQASILKLKGLTYYDSFGNYQEGLVFLKQSLEIQRQRKDLLGQAEILGWMASIYNFSGDKQNALASLKEALQLQKTALAKLSKGNNDLLTQSSVLSSIAVTYVSLYDLQEALNYLNQARLLRQKAGNRGLEALALSSIAYVYSSLGEKQKELDSLNKALALNHAIENSAAEAGTLNDIAETYLSMGEPQKALDSHNKALDIQRRLKLSPEEAKTLKDMALVYSSLGDYEQSLKTSEQALEIFEQLGDRNTEAMTLINMCNVSRKAQEYEQALKYCNSALKLSHEQKYFSDEQNALVGLVKVYELSKDYPKALDNAKKLEVLASQQNDNLNKGIALFFLSRVYLASGEYQKALESSKEGLSAWRNMKFRLGEANSLDYLGKIYNSLKQPQQAIETYNQLLALRQKMEDKVGEADTRYNLAVTERDRGNLEDALTQIQTTIEIVEGIRTKVTSEDLRTSYFATVQDYYKFYIDLLMQLHKKDPSKGYDAEALNISERSRARGLVELLTEARADIRNGVEPKLLATEQQLQQLIDAKTQLLQEASTKPNAEQITAKLQQEISDILIQQKELITKIRTSSPKYAAIKYPQPLELPQIQQQLDKDTLLLEYSLGKEHSYLWAVTPNSIDTYILPGREQIEKVANNFYKNYLTNPGIQGASTKETATVANSLSQLILAPVAQKLGQKRLVIVADGVLQQIPFAALTQPSTNSSKANNKTTYQPLIVNHEIVNLPSVTAVATQRQLLKGRKHALKTLALLANPVFETTDERVTGKPASTTQNLDIRGQIQQSQLQRAARSLDRNGWGALPGTAEEAKAILKLVPASDTLQAFGFDANYNWATSKQLSQYRFLHFATHGFANPINPELSGIVLSLVDKQGNKLSNGYLQLRDIFNLNFPADLVVLSACETGLGKDVSGEGLVGLTRGLMYAGAERVAVSLWRVDDDATAQLMQEFYKALLQQGKSPTTALREAQLKLWKDPNLNQPQYWAAFTLQGEWR
ncbi:MAG: CHAT domain-containing protein [Nostoc sp.]|uniref:CHAT domain-containing protein n=1 Tax=Nostoc sp. TaxID=1180 RepID=UPI002FFC1259